MKEIQQDIWLLLEPLWWRPSHKALLDSNITYYGVYINTNRLDYTDFYKNILDNI